MPKPINVHICERQNLPKASNLDIHNMKPIEQKRRLERERERERESDGEERRILESSKRESDSEG